MTKLNHELIQSLLDEGLSIVEIQSQTGVSKERIYRRIRKGKLTYVSEFRTLDECLIQNGKYTDRRVIRGRIIAEKRLPYVCSECNQQPIWNGNIKRNSV